MLLRCQALRHTVAVLLLSAVVASPGAGQSQIGGRVIDAGTNQPLAGAQISIAGTNQGVLTQANGRFLLLNVTQPTVTLEVVLLGYQTWSEQVARGTLDLEIRLEQRALELDMIVVTGTAGIRTSTSGRP